jgi:hypothetical protein
MAGDWEVVGTEPDDAWQVVGTEPLNPKRRIGSRGNSYRPPVVPAPVSVLQDAPFEPQPSPPNPVLALPQPADPAARAMNVLFDARTPVQSAVDTIARKAAAARREKAIVDASRERTDAAFGENPIVQGAIAPFRRMAAGGAQVVQGVASIPALFGFDAGQETAAAADLFAKSHMPADPTLADEVAAGLGQVVPLVRGAMAVRGALAPVVGAERALIAATGASGGVGGAMSGASVLQDLEGRDDLTAQDKQARALITAAISALTGAKADRLLLPGGSAADSIGGAMLRAGGVESAQEMGDQVTQNIATGRDAGDNVLRAGAVGGIVGGAVRGVGELQSDQYALANAIDADANAFANAPVPQSVWAPSQPQVAPAAAPAAPGWEVAKTEPLKPADVQGVADAAAQPARADGPQALAVPQQVASPLAPDAQPAGDGAAVQPAPAGAGPVRADAVDAPAQPAPAVAQQQALPPATPETQPAPAPVTGAAPAPQNPVQDDEPMGDSTADTIRRELSSRYGEQTIAALEKSGVLKIWNSSSEYNQTLEQGSRGAVDGRPQGAYFNGTAHLFGDGIQQGNAVPILLHESGEHAGMKQMLGEDRYADLARRAYQLADEGDTHARNALARIPDATNPRHFDSEMVAYLIEEAAAARASASPALRQWLSELVTAIRAWAYQTPLAKKLAGAGIDLKLTPNDIVALAERSIRQQAKEAGRVIARKGAKPAQQGDTQPKAPDTAAQRPNMGGASADTAQRSERDDDYRMAHRPPGRDGGAPLHDLTGGGNVYPDDVYGPRAAQFYGHHGGNHPQDRATMRLLQSLRGKPDADITIYRAVPSGAAGDIKAGDWVTVNRDYARDHGESTLEGDYKILEKRVKAREVFTNGDSIHEAGYWPDEKPQRSERRSSLPQSDDSVDDIMAAFGAEDGPTRDNASGESSASIEAQNRLKGEKRRGQSRVKVDRAGRVVPLNTVDGVDTFPKAGEVILQKGIGRDEWTVLDSGDGVDTAQRARSIEAAKRWDDTPQLSRGLRTVQVDGVRRPDSNSKGQPIFSMTGGMQGLINFWRWMGESAVVDEHGRPIPVYHGTLGDITQFDASRLGENTGAESAGMGFFFTDDPKTAESYANFAATDARVQRLMAEADAAERKAQRTGKQSDWDAYDAKVQAVEELDASFSDPQNRLAGQNTLPLYLAIQNPLRVDAKGENAVGFDIPAAIRRAKAGEHDGLIIENLDDAAGLVDRPATHYVAFKPEQVKSALGNVGQFDPSSADVRYSRSRGVSAEPGRDGWSADAEVLRNLTESPAFAAHGLRGLDVPSRRMVVARVLAVLDDFEVRQAVIESVPVDMVDILRRQQLSPEVLFNDMAVLRDLLSGNGDEAVAPGVNGARELPSRVARLVAEQAAALADVGARAGDRRAAGAARSGDASDLDLSALPAGSAQAGLIGVARGAGQRRRASGAVGSQGDSSEETGESYSPDDADIRYSRALFGDGDGAQLSRSPHSRTGGSRNGGNGDGNGGTPPRPMNRWRDATGRVQFAPGQVLYEMLGAAADPMLTALQMKPASPAMRRALREMKNEVAKAQEKSVEIAADARKLTDAERAMVSDLVERELATGIVPPEHAVRLAATINDVMGKQTDELVRLGMLEADTAERLRGKYLPRFYERKGSLYNGAVDAWADAVRRVMGRRQRMMTGIRGNHLKARGLFETIPQTQVGAYEAMGWEVRDPDYKRGRPTEDGTVQVWRDFTRAEREKMGEIRDAGFRFVMGYMQTQRDIALGRMFEQMAGDPSLSSRNASPEHTVRVPTSLANGTGAKIYGKLAGRWVSKDTLSHLSSIEEAQSEAWQMYRKAMAVWKEGKTALNPVSHVNNILSNLTMAHFAGVSYWEGWKYMAAAYDMARGSPMVKEAKEAGLFGGTISEAELMNLLPKELQDIAAKQESRTEKFGRSAFNALTLFLRRPMGAAYQAEDTFFRFLIYRDARGRGVAPADAVDYAQRFIFAYDDLPKGARRVRDFGLPFFSYTYKAVPALLHTALTHPLRFAAPAGVLWAANAIGYALAADDEDDWAEALRKYLTDDEFRAKARKQEQLEREHLPPWLKGTTALGTPKAVRLGMDEVTKLPLFIDTARIIPGGDMFDVSPNANGLPIPQPITPSHPLFTTAVTMLANKDMFTGKELVDANDTRGEAAEKRMAWLWRQFTPALAAGNYHWERGMQALAQANGGEVTWLPDALGGDATGVGRDGLPVQPKYAAMQTFGIKVRPIDIGKSRQMDRTMRDKMVRDIDIELSRLNRLHRSGAISERTLREEREQAREKQMRLRKGLTVDGDER